jgi:hypothetical protein
MANKNIIRRSVLQSIPNGERRGISFNGLYWLTPYTANNPPTTLAVYNGPELSPQLVKLTRNADKSYGFQIVCNVLDIDPTITGGQGYWNPS